MFFRRTQAAAIGAIVAAGFAGGCSRQSKPTVERLAIIPIENLSPNAQLNWFSAASAAALQYDLAGAKDLFAKPVDSLSAAQAMQASRALEGYFFERDGRIEMRATVEDLHKNQAVEHFEIGGPEAGGFLPLVNELARRLSSGRREFSTKNEKAFQLFGEALEASAPEAMVQALASAAAADPGFASAYLDEARVLAETGARDRALEVVRAGERGRLDSIDRANLKLVAAAASGNAGAQVDALRSLVSETPADAAVHTDLGAIQFSRRDFQGAVRSYQAATRLNPEEPGVWNQLGYALAWTGDLNAAREAIGQYEKLSPDDPNALDSIGEVSFFRHDFESAAKYFERAADKSPGEFVKAAEARLMTGDLQQADALFARYARALRAGHEGRAAYQTAQWKFLTGRRAAGIAAMEKLLPALSPDEQKLALRQLAIWKFETRQASPAGFGQTSGPLGLLLTGRFRDALPGLREAYQQANPSNDGQIRVLLAWALVETGSFDEAGRLLEMFPLPLSSGDPMFASLIFPRYLALRSEVLAKQGKPQEAKRDRDLYLKYGGAATN